MSEANATPTSVPQPQAEQPLFSESEARLRTQLYWDQRVKYQEEFYRARVEEFTFNSDRMLIVSAILMGISSVVSALSIPSGTPWLPFISALLPALAAVVTAFRALYQWERQAAIYDSSLLALEQAKLSLPDEDFIPEGGYSEAFPKLVQEVEDVLRAEASQWGQLESLLPSTTAPEMMKPIEPTELPPSMRRRTGPSE